MKIEIYDTVYFNIIFPTHWLSNLFLDLHHYLITFSRCLFSNEPSFCNYLIPFSTCAITWRIALFFSNFYHVDYLCNVMESHALHIIMQVDLLKHGISDPSLLTSSLSQSSSLGPEKDNKVREGEEYMATPVFVHTKWV